jgi:hypothetical protein
MSHGVVMASSIVAMSHVMMVLRMEQQENVTPHVVEMFQIQHQFVVME